MAKKEQESMGLRKLFEDQLADLYYVEKQLLKALPKMAKAANNDELRTAFEGHLKETEGQVERLEEIFTALDKAPKGKKCPAIDGILEEGREIMEEFSDDPALDAGLVGAAQKVEHYEITSYGSMKAWAEQLGLDDVVSLIEETLEEEEGADEKLSGIGESVVNIEADTAEDEMAEAETGGRSASGGKAAPPSKGGRSHGLSNGSGRKGGKR